MISEGLAADKEDAIRRCFQLLDRDNDGVILYKDLHQAMTTCGLVIHSEEVVNDWFTKLDLNENGRVSIDEFFPVIAKQTHITEIFRTLDRRGLKKVSLEDAVQVVSEWGGTGAQDSMNMLRLADQDKDGHLTYKEFVALMMSL